MLDHIVSIDSLHCFETSVLYACLKWARNACERNELDVTQTENLRQHLKDTLYKTRYGSIAIKDFAKFSDIFPQMFEKTEDYEEIIRIFAGCKTLPTHRFNTKPRSTELFAWEPSKNLIFDLTVEEWEGPPMQQSQNIIKLSSYKPLLLGGFKMCKIFGEDLSVGMVVTIIEKYENHSKEVLRERCSLFSKPSPDASVDLSKKPVVINPEYSYHIHLKMDQCVSFRTTEMNTEIKLNDDVTISYDTNHFNSTGANFNSVIQQIYFNAL